MGTKPPLMEVDPLSLPLGMQVGRWRIKGWRGRGTYGTVYRVERDGREAAGSFALKLAIYPRDERFEREVVLLSRIQSPQVPRLYDHGLWEHPSGAFPYLVLEWVSGVDLYEWAERRNPTSRQVLRLLAQVARALEATHAAGGVHRDVKGDNVLVRPADGRAVLTDFGAGDYKGAATLTSRSLPPGTNPYRSPEAWDFQRIFLNHPFAHYEASACDDLFALGVTAYRLVTDEYPPSTYPEQPGADVWRAGAGGPGLRSPRALNPSVCLELEALILRLLACSPGERFHGSAQQAAEAMDQAARDAGPEADVPLFFLGLSTGLRQRAHGVVRRSAGQDAAAKEELERHRLEEQARSRTVCGPARPHASVSVRNGGATVALGLLLVLLGVTVSYRGTQAKQEASREGGTSAVGDNAMLTPISTLAPEPSGDRASAVGLPLPERPFRGQRTPPCTRNGEVEIRGGCWYRLGDARPPCKEDAYDWKGECYLPSFPIRARPTSDPQ